MKNIRTIYNQFLSLRENLPKGKHVGKKYVDEFHRLLKSLESLVNYSLGDYCIDQSLLNYTSGVSHVNGEFTGFGELQCERGFLLIKLDAILLMFASEDKPPMGFHAPNQN